MQASNKSKESATRAKKKYNAKAYDNILLVLPKGYKDKIKKHTITTNESINGFINRAIREAIEKDCSKLYK